MRLSPLFVTLTVSLSIACVTACGDDGGSTGNQIDAPTGTTIDAPAQTQMDAPPAATAGLGTACTPGAGTAIEQGDCPTGFVCLNLQDGTHPWCSKSCTAGAPGNALCDSGYTGPGVGACYLGVNSATYCGVICQSANVQICPVGQCDSTCPSTPPLACTASISDGNAEVAKGCE